MILVCLGTQDKKFTRLLDELERLCREGKVESKIVVQAGYTDFKSEYMDIRKWIPNAELVSMLKEAEFLICHGGVANIMEGVELGKRIISVPRLEKYKEHTNDHQLDIVSSFAEKKYLLPVFEISDLEKVLLEIKEFKPKKFNYNQDKFVIDIDVIIKDFLKK